MERKDVIVLALLLSSLVAALPSKSKPKVVKGWVYEPQNPTQIWRSLSRTEREFPHSWFAQASSMPSETPNLETRGKYVTVFEQDTDNCPVHENQVTECFDSVGKCFVKYRESDTTQLVDITRFPANLQVGKMSSDRASSVFFFMSRLIDVMQMVMKQDGSAKNQLAHRLWPYSVQVAVLPCTRLASQAFSVFLRDSRNQVLVLSKGRERITLLDAIVRESPVELVQAMATRGVKPKADVFSQEEIEEIRVDPRFKGLSKVLNEARHSSYWSSSCILHEASHIVFQNILRHPPQVQSGSGLKTYFESPFKNALDEGIADYLSCAIKFIGKSSVDCVIGGSFERRWWQGLRTAVYYRTKAPHVDNTFHYIQTHGCVNTDTHSCESHRLGQLIASVLWRAHANLKDAVSDAASPSTIFHTIREKAKSYLKTDKQIMRDDIRMIKIVLQGLQDSMFSEAKLDTDLLPYIIFRDCLLSHPDLTERQFEAIQHSFTLHGYGSKAIGILGDESTKKFHPDANEANEVDFVDRRSVYRHCPRLDPAKVIASIQLDISSAEEESDVEDQLDQLFQQVFNQNTAAPPVSKSEE